MENNSQNRTNASVQNQETNRASNKKKSKANAVNKANSQTSDCK